MLAGGFHPLNPEDAMRGTLTLNVENLAVDSFETAPAPPQPGTVGVEKLATCLETDCGRYRCCA
jgi:hypothetical protein